MYTLIEDTSSASAGSAPSPTGEGLGDMILLTIVLNKAKVLAFYQSTVKRTA
jgi:hypothetical protein